MANSDKSINAYIEKQADFARPVLSHLRTLVHMACPQVEETIKENIPHFKYKGYLCHMKTFNDHCSFGFHKADMINESVSFLNSLGLTGLGHFDQITSIVDLPADNVMISYIHEAMRLNDEDLEEKE